MSEFMNFSLDFQKLGTVERHPKTGEAFIRLASVRNVKEKDGKFYLDVNVSIKDDFDQFGNNVSAAIGNTKEQREAGEKTQYIGNGRVLKSDHYPTKSGAPTNVQAEKTSGTIYSGSGDDLPF